MPRKKKPAARVDRYNDPVFDVTLDIGQIGEQFALGDFSIHKITHLLGALEGRITHVQIFAKEK